MCTRESQAHFFFLPVSALALIVWHCLVVPTPLDDQLVTTVKDGSRQTVQALLRAGANANATDANGDPVLLLACDKRRKHVVKLLLDAGANPHATDSQGRTALHRDESILSTRIVKALLAADADANARDNNGCTPAQAAINRDADRPAYTLAMRGADIPTKPVRGFLKKLQARNMRVCQSKHHSALRRLIDRLWVRQYGMPEQLIQLVATFVGGEQLLAMIERRRARAREL